MIEVNKYTLPEVIPQSELNAWRSNIKKVEAEHCPPEVREFIAAVSAKLPDFGQTGKFNTLISGYELTLSGMTEMNGEQINPWEVYQLPVPKMQAVDHHAAMHRAFHKRGKQGLIDYCRARVKDTELERLLDVLNVHVFHQEREEFKKVMAEIHLSKKIDTQIDV